MTARRLLPALVACLALFAVSAGVATGAKIPTYHVYKKCKTKTNCPGAAYTNKKSTRLITFNYGRECSDGSFIQLSYSGSLKISKKGKFKFTADVDTFDQGSSTTVRGTATVNGKVKKKEKVSGSFSVDKVASACDPLKSGKFSFKYKGTQQGG